LRWVSAGTLALPPRKTPLPSFVTVQLAGDNKQAGKFRGEWLKRVVRQGKGLDGLFLRLRRKIPRMWQEGQKIIKRLPFLPLSNCQAAKSPPSIAYCPGWYRSERFQCRVHFLT
jgi:hypothetical protein